MAPKRPRGDLASATSSTATDGGKRVKFAGIGASSGGLGSNTSRGATVDNDDQDEELAMGETGGAGSKRKNVVVTGYDSDSSAGDDDDARDKAKQDGDDDDDDMFGDKPEQKTQQKKKKKKEFLEMADIEGQEFGKGDDNDDDDDLDEEEEEYYEEDDLANDDDAPKSKRSKEGMGYKLTSFNMKQELDEGRFDADGSYVANKKDPLEKHDAWLDGMSKATIKAARQAKLRLDRQAKERDLQEANKSEALVAQERDDCLIGILKIVKPGETPAKALARLGALKKKRYPNGPPPKKRAKPQQEQERMHVDDDDDEHDARVDNSKGKGKEQPEQLDPISAKIDTLTRLTSTLLSTHGELEIYDESYEDIVKTLKSEGAVRRDWVPPTASPDASDDDDDDHGRSTQQASGGRRTKPSTLISRPSAAATTTAPSATDTQQFMYKWVSAPPGQPADQEHGPFSKAQLDQWVQGGFFGEQGDRIVVKVPPSTEWQKWNQIQ